MVHLPAVHAVIATSSAIAGVASIAVVTGVASIAILAVIATFTNIATGFTGVTHVDVVGGSALLIPVAGRRGRARGPGLTGNGGVRVLLRKHVEKPCHSSSALQTYHG